MGLSWTDRVEGVPGRGGVSVLGPSSRPPLSPPRPFPVPWAKTFAAGHRKRAYRWDRNGEPSGFLFLCLCESRKGWEFLGGEQVSDSLDALVGSGRGTEFWSDFLSSSRDLFSAGPLFLPNLVEGSPTIACP